MTERRGAESTLPLSAPVDVFEAHDVVLAQIAADLYLDQFKPNLAGVGEPMDAADRDVDGFVFVHAALVSAERHFGHPLDHDPMLGSVEMLLQGQLAAWLHDDPVHPVARGNVDVLIVTPRAVDPAMLDRRAMILRLQLLHKCLDLLGLGARTHQHRVRGRHHDDVIEPDHGGQHGLLRAHQAVAGVQHDDWTFGRIAGGVVIENVPDRVPAADIGPTDVSGNHGGELGTDDDRPESLYVGRSDSLAI